jgi:hypothetical protein
MSIDFLCSCIERFKCRARSTLGIFMKAFQFLYGKLQKFKDYHVT